jgi:hypothetical protein
MGWQLLHTSTLIIFFVAPVVKLCPQAQTTLASEW